MAAQHWYLASNSRFSSTNVYSYSRRLTEGSPSWRYLCTSTLQRYKYTVNNILFKASNICLSRPIPLRPGPGFDLSVEVNDAVWLIFRYKMLKMSKNGKYFSLEIQHRTKWRCLYPLAAELKTLWIGLQKFASCHCIMDSV